MSMAASPRFVAPAGLILNVNAANYTNTSTITDAVTGVSWNMTGVTYNPTRNTLVMSSGGIVYNNGGTGPASFNTTSNTQVIIYYRLGNSPNPGGQQTQYAVGGALFNIDRTPAISNDESMFYECGYWEYSNGYGIQLFSSTNINGSSGWVMRAFVKNGATGTFYLNGRPDGTTTAGSGSSIVSNGICIGKDYRDSVNYLNAEVAWAGIWNVALTSDQILYIYNKLALGYGTFAL